EPGAAVHVEPVRAVPEEPVVWPARAREDRPVEAEAHEAELAPVRVPRQRQVRLARRHVPEAQRIVQEKEAEMSRTPRETCQKLEDVLAMSLADPVRAEKLHRADSSLDDRLVVHQERDARRGEGGADLALRLVIVVAEDREAAAGEPEQRLERAGERARRA